MPLAQMPKVESAVTMKNMQLLNAEKKKNL